MKFKTFFKSDHDLLLFFNMSNQFLAPGGLNAECVQVSVMKTWGFQGAGSEAPRPESYNEKLEEQGVLKKSSYGLDMCDIWALAIERLGKS